MIVDDPERFIGDLGHLHDCVVASIAIDPASRTLRLKLADLHANFADLPDDPGRRPATLVFHDLSYAEVALNLLEPPRISELNVRGQPGYFHLELWLSQGGNMAGWRTAATFSRLEVVEVAA